MSIGERIRELRKSLSLNQTDFGNRLGLKQNTIGQIENGGRNLTDRNISLICEKFSVNEEWLRFGEGPMRSEKPDQFLDELAKRYDLDETGRLIASICLRMPPEQRRAVVNFVVSVAEALGNPANAAASSFDVSDLNDKLDALGACDPAAASVHSDKKSPA